MTIFEKRKGNYLLSTDHERLDVPFIHSYLSNESYWAKGIPMETVERSIRHSLCFGLYDENGQIGFARIVSDFATFAYLADVFIDEKHRGNGLSKWMMECITAHPNLQGLRKWLLGTKDAHGLYRQFGFTELASPGRFMEWHHPNVYSK